MKKFFSKLLIMSLVCVSIRAENENEADEAFDLAIGADLKEVALSAYPSLSEKKVKSEDPKKTLKATFKLKDEEIPPTKKALTDGGKPAVRAAVKQVIKNHEPLLKDAGITVTGV